MSEAPAVTVLLPVRNAAPFLREALESLRAQTFTRFEILAIDDGSTDDSASILRGFGDPRLRVVRASGAGLVDALNQGLHLCESTYIARMDADDRSLPQRLERQFRALETDASLAMVGARAHVVDAHGRRIGSPAVLQDDRAIRRALAVANCFSHGTVMFRRSAVLAAGGYRADAPKAEDYDLWTRLAPLGKLANLPETLYEWRSHAGGVSRSSRESQREMADTLADRYWDGQYAAEGPAPQAAWPEIWTDAVERGLGANLHLEFARGYAKRDARALALRHAAAALALRPSAAAAWAYLPALLLPAPWFLALDARARSLMEDVRGW